MFGREIYILTDKAMFCLYIVPCILNNVYKALLKNSISDDKKYTFWLIKLLLNHRTERNLKNNTLYTNKT